MAHPDRKPFTRNRLIALLAGVLGLLTWTAILFQPLAAQAQECVTPSQFLAGDFDRQAAPCGDLRPYQLAYCARREVTQRDTAALLATSDFGKFLVSIWPEQAEAAITQADAGRLAALQDDTLPNGYSALFYLLYTRLLAALVSEAQPSLDPDSLFAHREIEVEFFPHHLRGGVSFFQRALRCAVSCGAEAIDAKRLTRSPVFLQCIG
ncbi:MAG TPA: hypothetical protein ENJ52_11345 [Aliiroseovarius sp.]|nr:hypothetical protein [Aliiroseovarius sp.]